MTPVACCSIGNRWVSGNGETVRVVNPATEEVIVELVGASAETVDMAVHAAVEAFQDGGGVWPQMTGDARAAILHRVADSIEAEGKSLAQIECRNTGKPMVECLWDMEDVVGCFRYFAVQAIERHMRTPGILDVGMEEFSVYTVDEPMGVIAAIVPWNYPLLMATWKVAPALAAGCCVVLKPSEVTPLTALELARIMTEAGLPSGVLSVLPGAGDIGHALATHRRIDKVSFTGSVPTGSRVMQSCGPRIANVCLELGGKSSLLVFSDVDLDIAVEWAMFGCFWTNGQICSATSRLLVHQDIYEQFKQMLIRYTCAIPIIDPLDTKYETTKGAIGPLINASQYEKVFGFVERAVKEGAKILCGGKRPPQHSKGYFIEPTVLETTRGTEIWNEEVFGPVLSIMPFETEDEAVELANDTPFGLASGVLSRDKTRCKSISRRLRSGVVWVNCSQPCFYQAPWGGMKQSGIGRELGPHGIDAYLETKQICEYLSAAPWGWYRNSSIVL